MQERAVHAEIVEDEAPRTALAIRDPQPPTTLAELAALKGEALEIITARVKVLRALRNAAIESTSPEDWLLFRDRESRTVGYLQDCGCDRVRDLYGIEIFNVSVPQRIEMSDGNFMYIMSGDGRCRLTCQTVEMIEGGRPSTDDFCKDKRGHELELAVRKSTRANLDGNITRELSGLNSVPLQELQVVWGPNKPISRCRLGRGFGTGSERLGADMETAAGVLTSQAPKCPTCESAMTFKEPRAGGKQFASFWSCTKYPNCKGTRKAEGEYSLERLRQQAGGAAAADDDAPPHPAGESAGSGKTPASTSAGPLITEPQGKRFYAIARGAGFKDDASILEFLSRYGYESVAEIPAKHYEEIVKALQQE